MDSAVKAEPSIGDLLGNLSRETGLLVRQEVQLAGAEMGEKAKVVARDVALLAAGGAVALAGFLVLLAAVVMILGGFMPMWASALVVGGVALLGGGVLAMSGLASLKRLSPLPEQTIQTLREDKAMLKEQLR